jgi:predicted dinucleotide-binding enzyme
MSIDFLAFTQLYFLSVVIAMSTLSCAILNHQINKSTMKNLSIGVIGAGAIGLSFAKTAAAAGYQVTVSNSRGPESLRSTILGIQNLSAGTTEDSAAADIVMVALTWKQLADNAKNLPNLSGKIVLDPMNPVIMPGFIIPDLGEKTSSEVVAASLPGARLVKVFNTLPPSLIMADPKQNNGNRVVFYSGDDADAKAVVEKIVTDMGFAGIDLGTLQTGGRLQQFPGGSLPSLNLIKL